MINYGGYTATKSISVPQPFPIKLDKQGDGSGVTKIMISTDTAGTIEIENGFFYDDINGNSGQRTSEPFLTGFNRTTDLYIKVASGEARLKSSTKKITEINTILIVGVNSPIPKGTLDNCVDLTYISDGTGILSNLNTNCTKLVNLIELDQKGGIVSGTLNNSPNLERLTIVGNNHTVSYNVALAKSGFTWEVVGLNMNFYGDLTNSNPGFFYGNALRNCTADASAWTNLIYWQTECPAELHSGATIAACGMLNITHSVLSTADVNAILAGIRANIDTPKGYREATRYFNLQGAEGTGAPSGQGIIDAQWIRDHVGPQGQTNTVLTR